MNKYIIPPFIVEGDHTAHEAEQASFQRAAETHPAAGVQPLSDRPGEAEQLRALLPRGVRRDLFRPGGSDHRRDGNDGRRYLR